MLITVARWEEVKTEDIVVGKGPEVHHGDLVKVHYTGTLLDGTKFDSSHDHPGGQPFETLLIPGRVIQGWTRGIPGMHVGGRRKLTIPPSLGYGASPHGPIPANSTLVFDVEVLDTKGPGQVDGGLPPPIQMPMRPRH